MTVQFSLKLTQLERTHVYKSSREPRAGEVVGPREDPITIIFPKECIFQLFSKHSFLYPQINIALASHQRTFLFCNRWRLLESSTLVKTQESDHGVASLKLEICNTALILREHCGREDRKTHRNLSLYNSVSISCGQDRGVALIKSGQCGCLHKTYKYHTNQHTNLDGDNFLKAPPLNDELQGINDYLQSKKEGGYFFFGVLFLFLWLFCSVLLCFCFLGMGVSL